MRETETWIGEGWLNSDLYGIVKCKIERRHRDREEKNSSVNELFSLTVNNELHGLYIELYCYLNLYSQQNVTIMFD